MVAQAMATVSSGALAGVGALVAVRHQARLRSGIPAAVAALKHRHERAALVQMGLAVLGMTTGVLAWRIVGHTSWLVGGIFTGSALPLTALAIMPTAAQLRDPATPRHPTDAQRLLARWGNLHAIVAVQGFAALAVFAFDLIGD